METIIERKIEINRIANILINMALGMDYADYTEHYQESIDELSTEIDALRFRCPELFTVLETIALKNEVMEDWSNFYWTILNKQ